MFVAYISDPQTGRWQLRLTDCLRSASIPTLAWLVSPQDTRWPWSWSRESDCGGAKWWSLQLLPSQPSSVSTGGVWVVQSSTSVTSHLTPTQWLATLTSPLSHYQDNLFNRHQIFICCGINLLVFSLFRDHPHYIPPATIILTTALKGKLESWTG